MVRLMYTEFQCELCELWFKKSEREAHRDAYGHHFSGAKRVIGAVTPPVKSKMVEFELQRAKPPVRVLEVVKPVKRALDVKYGRFTGDSKVDYPNMSKILASFRLFAQAEGII